ncbi:MAG TPA: addiction module toxin RelE [Blastocatellia bacterium]|nr:addiction module toxin RelE [Blastocatellia bacterium]
MKLELTNDARSFLEDLPSKQYKQVATKIFELLRNPYPQDAKHIKGLLGYRRITSGEFRVVYKVEGETIRIALIGKRNDDEVYKLLDRKRF